MVLHPRHNLLPFIAFSCLLLKTYYYQFDYLSLRRINHPSGNETEGRPTDQVIVLENMIAGIGNDVVQPKAALSSKR